MLDKIGRYPKSSIESSRYSTMKKMHCELICFFNSLRFSIILDKLRKGKRDGTPEKPTTPSASQDALQEEGSSSPEKKQVIVNDEILAMQIKADELHKV